MNWRKIILISSFFLVLLTSLLPQNIYTLVVFSMLVWLLLPFKKWWDKCTVGLLLFSVFYTTMILLSGKIASGFLTISYLISPVAFYRFGNYLLTEYTNESSRFKLLLFIGFSYLLQMFLLTFVDIAVVGLVNEDRTLLGTSTEDDALAATIYGLMAAFGIGCLGGCFAPNQKFIIRILYVLLLGFSLLTVVHLVNRGGLVIFVISLLLTIFIYNRRDSLKLLSYTVLIGLCIIFILSYGLISDDILMAYESRNDHSEYGMASAGGRTELWLVSLKNFFTHPLGWTQDSYAHNLWLDMAKIGGWFSLLPFLVVTFSTINKCYNLYRKFIVTFPMTLLVLNIALLAAAFIEPVIEGSMLYFSILIMIWGMISMVYKEGLGKRSR